MQDPQPSPAGFLPALKVSIATVYHESFTEPSAVPQYKQAKTNSTCRGHFSSTSAPS